MANLTPYKAFIDASISQAEKNCCLQLSLRTGRNGKRNRERQIRNRKASGCLLQQDAGRTRESPAEAIRGGEAEHGQHHMGA